MNDRNKELKDSLVMSVIDHIIFTHRGVGTTVELSPILTKEVTYESELYCGLFNKVWKWKKKHVIKAPSSILINNWHKVDYNVNVPHEIAAMLPSGIEIQKKPIQVIADERTKYSPLSELVYNAYYYEGHRVYLSVSDEYAEKFYREKYTDIAYPFRDNLLKNHSILLQKIVQSRLADPWFMWSCHNSISVSAEKVAWGSSKNEQQSFQQLNMMPLNSSGQVYGMALALIESIKNSWSESSNYVFSIDSSLHDSGNGIRILRITINPLLPPSDQKELQEW